MVSDWFETHKIQATFVRQFRDSIRKTVATNSHASEILPCNVIRQMYTRMKLQMMQTRWVQTAVETHFVTYAKVSTAIYRSDFMYVKCIFISTK